MKFNTYGSPESPCALLLHTMFTTGALFDELRPALEERFFLAVPTLDGYEPGEDGDYPETGAELDWIEAFLLECGVRELAVAAGSSLGAMLAWALWNRGNIPIRRLVLDSPPFGWDDAVARENTEGFWQLAQAVRAAPPEETTVFEEHYGRFGPMMRASCAAASYDTLRRSCETCFGPRLPERIASNGTEIVLVYGDQDPNYQEKRQELEGRSDLKLLLEPGYGHCGFLMRRPLEFARLLMGGITL